MKTLQLFLTFLCSLLFINGYSQSPIFEYKEAGDEAYHIFRTERDKQFIDPSTVVDEEKMYNSLYRMYENYVYLIQNRKAMINDTVFQDIALKLKEDKVYFVNGGIYYHTKQDYIKASDFFLAYWDIPNLRIYKSDDFEQNSERQVIKYYAAISAYQSDDSQRAIVLLNRLISEPYIQNDTYKESDPYELLTLKYQDVNDQENYLKTLSQGMYKFPGNKYFMPSLINEYIKNNDLKGAIKLLDKAIKDNVLNACIANNTKGAIYTEQREEKKAEKAYKEALKKDPECAQTVERLAVLYILIAQDTKDNASQTTNQKRRATLDLKAKKYYEKGLKFLVEHRNLLEKKGATKSEIMPTLYKLQNVYYNLTLFNVDLSEEYDKISNEIEKLCSE